MAELEAFDGILVPGGFGRRGVEGMLCAIRYARECKVPYFGICLGMQTMVIEFARNVCGLDASQLHRVRSGHARSRDLQAARAERRRRAGRHHAPGRVSLPARRRQLRARAPTASREISERHRHRYEFNREYEGILKQHGLRLTGETPDGVYVEICELAGSSLVSGLPVPSRVQIQAAGAASFIPRVHRRRARASPQAAPRRRSADQRSDTCVPASRATSVA